MNPHLERCLPCILVINGAQHVPPSRIPNTQEKLVRVFAIVLQLLLFSLLAPVAAQELLSKGTPYETPTYVIHGKRPGPCVVIVGGCHGNEPAGAYAANEIRKWRIARGKLVVIPRMNPPSLKLNQRYMPNAPKNLRDLNRNYGGKPRGEVAGAIWEFIVRHKPDWVLDLHEGYDFNVKNKKSVGSSVIACQDKSSLKVADLMLDAVNDCLIRPDVPFQKRGPPIKNSLAWAAGRDLGAHAMTLETTTKSQALSFRVRQHRIMVHRLLRHLRMVGKSSRADSVVSMDAKQKVRVALYDSTGTSGKGVPRITKLLGERDDVELVRVCGRDIRNGILRQFDCVIFSGGSGSGQAKGLKASGRKAVSRFVKDGGGFVGICAGSYLACSGFEWGLGLLQMKTRSSKWRRGRGMVRMAMTEKGEAIFGSLSADEILYANGPILESTARKGAMRLEPLAHFQTELAENGTPPGIMKGSPSIVGGDCGKGRAICFSPHPEQSKGFEDWVARAVQWTTKRAR